MIAIGLRSSRSRRRGLGSGHGSEKRETVRSARWRLALIVVRRPARILPGGTASQPMALDVFDIELVAPDSQDRVASDPLHLQSRRHPNRALCSPLRIEDYPISRPARAEVVDFRPEPAQFVYPKRLESRQRIGYPDVPVGAVPFAAGARTVPCRPPRNLHVDDLINHRPRDRAAGILDAEYSSQLPLHIVLEDCAGHPRVMNVPATVVAADERGVKGTIPQSDPR